MPPGVPFIVANEAAERFSYYGMRGILVVFMTRYMLDSAGSPDTMSDEQAKAWYHVFLSAVYFFPLFGAILSDSLLGKYRTIFWLSLVYCLGHLALAIDTTRMGMAVGLTLIAIGSGGIKPCVSSNVGDQFGSSNQHLLPKVFGWFYFSVNAGSALATLFIPWLLKQYGPHVAFGTPGAFMFLATFFFWLGRRRYVHIPPGGKEFVRQTFSWTGLRSIGKLFVIYLFVAVFWCLYDQTSSAWILQASKMDLHAFGLTWLPAQVHSVNPILILLYIPLFTYVVYPLLNRVFPLTPLRKMGIGFVLTAVSFLIPAWVETRIAAGEQPSLYWQILAYMIITAAEVMVSITCLEFSYTQAPKHMKALVMACYNLSVSLGNWITALVNYLIKGPNQTSLLTGAEYYLFFATLMLVTSMIFIGVAKRYREETHIQQES
jgi:POT family proton-dependent oligopeptide transporter